MDKATLTTAVNSLWIVGALVWLVLWPWIGYQIGQTLGMLWTERRRK